MPTPKIFTVHVFKLVDGARRLDVHYVAATTSAEAEKRIAASHAAHLAGQCFITTDELEEAYGHSGVKCYVTSYRSGGPITDEEFAHWQRAMTRASRVEGACHPAAFRRFHVKGARKAERAAIESLAA